MIISATGEGRRGYLNDGCGALSFRGATEGDAKKLLVLYEEVRDGYLGFWTCLMWATRNDRLTKVEKRSLDRIVDRLGREFDGSEEGSDEGVREDVFDGGRGVRSRESNRRRRRGDAAGTRPGHVQPSVRRPNHSRHGRRTNRSGRGLGR